MNRNWRVLLIGGASGSGKTCISYPLAKLFSVNLIEVDDFQEFLFAMTTADEQAALHYWDTHPDWQKEGVGATVSQLVNVGKAMSPGLEAVIRNHIESDVPVIIEGDFLLPDLCTSFPSDQVKAVFVHELSRDQILKNYLQREGSVQEYRTNVSIEYGNWLAKECVKYDILVLESRPWDTVLERVMEMLA